MKMIEQHDYFLGGVDVDFDLMKPSEWRSITCEITAPDMDDPTV